MTNQVNLKTTLRVKEKEESLQAARLSKIPMLSIGLLVFVKRELISMSALFQKKLVEQTGSHMLIQD